MQGVGMSHLSSAFKKTTNVCRLKDGRNVVPTDRYILQNFHDDIFSLLIKDVKTEDSGCYTCLAKNEYGEAKTEALLNVLGESQQWLDIPWTFPQVLGTSESQGFIGTPWFCFLCVCVRKNEWTTNQGEV